LTSISSAAASISPQKPPPILPSSALLRRLVPRAPADMSRPSLSLPSVQFPVTIPAEMLSNCHVGPEVAGWYRGHWPEERPCSG
jgi:hypothetical protein